MVSTTLVLSVGSVNFEHWRKTPIWKNPAKCVGKLSQSATGTLSDPVISEAGLHLLIVAGPKQQDLRRDGRYALHSETCPPPRQDDGFALAGRASEVTDAALRQVVRGRVLTERDGKV